MEYIQGKFVRVHLKGREIPNVVSGILIGFEDDHVYIQSHPGEDGLFVIPQENIRYYQTSEASFVDKQTEPVSTVQKEPEIRELSVFVDKEFITTIPVPPTFDLNTCTDDTLRVAWGNPDVKSALTGRIQKTIEYYPGVIKFITETQPVPAVKSENTFAMGNTGSPASTFLSPSDMVARLSNLKNKGNNNEQQ